MIIIPPDTASAARSRTSATKCVPSLIGEGYPLNCDLGQCQRDIFYGTGHSYAAIDPSDVIVVNLDNDSSPVHVTEVSVSSPPVTAVGVVFSEPMAMTQLIADGTITSAVAIVSLSSGPVTLTSDQFHYDETTRTLTWSSVVALPGGCYELRLDGSMLADKAGNLLVGGEGGVMFNLPNFAAAAFLQSDGADLQSNSYSVPSLADWNNDGLLEFIVGEKTVADEGKVRVYLNTSSAATPVYDAFSYAQSSGADLAVVASGCLGAYPRVFDRDGDGKRDLIVGLADGTVQWFPNVNTNADPTFGAASRLQVGQPGSKQDIDVVDRATFDIVDWNNDGQYDLVMGAVDGRVRVYLNEALSGPADLRTELVVQDGPADLLTPSGRSSVAVVDLNGDGRKDLLVGNTDGQLLFYANAGTDSAPAFNGAVPIEAAGAAIDLPDSPRSRPFVGDFNADGDLDLLRGSENGLVRLYVGHAQDPNDGGLYVVDGVTGGVYVHTFLVPLNIPPVADPNGHYTIAEGDNTLVLDGSGSIDLDAGQTLTYTWTANGTEFAASQASTLALDWLDLQAIGIDDGLNSFEVALLVADDFGATDSAETTLTVNNVAPTASLSNDGPIDEGSTAVVTVGSQFDPSSVDTTTGFLYSYDFDNDGTFEVTGSALASAVVLALYLADGPGTQTVLARIEDRDGGYSEYTTDIGIDNVAPTANAGGPYTAEENVAVALNGSGADPGTLDTLTYEWDLSYDGVAFVVDVVGQNISHTWTDDFAGNVPLRVTHNDGASHIDVAAVTVTNVNPEADAGTGQTVNEGDTVDFSSTATDQSPNDEAIFTYAWDFGDANDPTPGSGATPSHVYTDDGTYTVTLTVTDDDGGVVADTLAVTVNNVVPTASLSNDGPVDEGSTAVVTFGSQLDPSSADTTAGFLYSYDFNNDGTFDVTGSTLASVVVPASYLADGPGTRTVLARIEDKDGGHSEHTTDIGIGNVAPTVEIVGAPASSPEGSEISLSANVTDPGSDGSTYSWAVTTNGDPYEVGSDSTFTFTPDDGDADYITSLTVTDDDTGTTDAVAKTVSVLNVSPTIALTGDNTVDEGADYTLTLGTITDPGDDTVTQWTVHWGDWLSDSYSSGGDRTHVYANDGTYTVSVNLVDEDGTYTDAGSLDVMVNPVGSEVVDLGQIGFLLLEQLSLGEGSLFYRVETNVFVGYGYNPSGQTEAWVLATPEPSTRQERFIIGSDKHNPVEFNPSSWSERVMVWQAEIRKGQSGAVPIFAEVDVPGTYRFSLRRWLEEVNKPIRASADLTVPDGFSGDQRQYQQSEGHPQKPSQTMHLSGEVGRT